MCLLKLKLSTTDIKILQQLLANKVITKDFTPKKIKTICGIDAAYKNGRSKCAAIIFNSNEKKIAELKTSILKDAVPYIPGYFMLKESKPILNTIKKLKKKFDVLLVDGNGQLHPRHCGLACFIGLILDKPVIGVAKKLLCGKVQPNSKVNHEGKTVGYEIKKGKKKIYVSIGHKISLRTAVKIVRELVLDDKWYPEPLRLADLNSKFK